MTLIICLAMVPAAFGHWAMTSPPPRYGVTMSDFQDGTFWFNEGSQIGCKESTATTNISCGNSPCGAYSSKACCDTLMEPTLTDPKLLSYATSTLINGTKIDNRNTMKHNPWRAPGHSPIASSCGIAAGAPSEHTLNGGNAPPGYKAGVDYRDLPKKAGQCYYKTPSGAGIYCHNYEAPDWRTFPSRFGRPKDEAQCIAMKDKVDKLCQIDDVEMQWTAFSGTKWPAGSKQEVAWGVKANHGGGYAWRLCPASSALTEQCFQSGHLKFAGKAWVQVGSNATNRTSFVPTYTSEGTKPAGSMWGKNPIAPCSQPVGGLYGKCEAPAWEPPLPWLFGYGTAACLDFHAPSIHPIYELPVVPCTLEDYIAALTKFSTLNIIDLVQVPEDLAPGDYVLSMRFDSEQTPQVWNQCADVTITPALGAVLV